jgi:hypothetical protein
MMLPPSGHRRWIVVVSLGLATSVAAAADAPRAVEERLASDVTRLASDEWQGRRAGTEQADAAAAWIAEELARAGLEPAGDGGSWFQEFSFIDGVVVGPGNRLSMVGGPTWKAGEDFRPLAFSSPGHVTGEVAFVGYGISAPDLARDDYQGIDVKGRVVLALRYGPDGDDSQSKWAAFSALRLKAMTARDRGAAALLVVTGPLTHGVKDELVPVRTEVSLSDAGLPIFSVRQDVAETLLAKAGTTLEAAHRRAHPDAGAKAATPSFPLAGVRVDLTADVSPKRSRTRNVVGLLRAARSDAESIVVGAHYDHLGLGGPASLDPAPEGKIHHGADDNASGTAALLALARSLGPRRGTLERNLVFVSFGAEEEGTLGSSHFVKQPPAAAGRIAAMVNMDMIGRLREDSLAVDGVGTSPVWRPLLEEANKSLGLKLQLGEGGYGPSDHSPFYAAGTPVLFAFTGNHSDYHRPSDTADKINAAGMAKVLALLEPVIVGVAASRAPVPFVRVAADKEMPQATRGFRVWVGGVPDYSEEAPGVRFSGVTPGSPAEKAGFQAGDLLVRFGGREIRNIYDYTYALSDRKPGDVVEAVVRRGASEVTLVVTLGLRPGEAR